MEFRRSVLCDGPVRGLTADTVVKAHDGRFFKPVDAWYEIHRPISWLEFMHAFLVIVQFAEVQLIQEYAQSAEIGADPVNSYNGKAAADAGQTAGSYSLGPILVALGITITIWSERNLRTGVIRREKEKSASYINTLMYRAAVSGIIYFIVGCYVVVLSFTAPLVAQPAAQYAINDLSAEPEPCAGINQTYVDEYNCSMPFFGENSLAGLHHGSAFTGVI